VNSPLGASPLKVVVLEASPNAESKTASLAGIAVSIIEERYSISLSTVNVYGIGTGLTSAIMRSDVDERAEEALQTVEGADLLLVAVPVYRGSYPGMFKHFMDLIDQYALATTPVMLMATGGGEKHALVIDHALRPLFAFFHAFVAPVGVYACSADFDKTVLLNPGIYTRIQLAVDDMSVLLKGHEMTPGPTAASANRDGHPSVV
jgi:FMN reductase